MNIYEGRLDDLLSWFGSQMETDILGLLVSLETGVSDQIRRLIRDVDYVDALLGSRVTMMLFGPEPTEGLSLGEVDNDTFAMGGELIERPYLPRRLALEVRAVKRHRHSHYFYEAVRRSTLHTMEDIMQTADVPRGQLPCLVLYLRTIERPFVISLEAVGTPERLLQLFRLIADLHDAVMRIPRPKVIGLHDLQIQIDRLNKSNHKIDSKLERLIRHLHEFAREYSIPNDQIEKLAGRYRSFRFNNIVDELRPILVDDNHAAFSDHRIMRIQGLINGLKSVQRGLRDFTEELRNGVLFAERMASIGREIEQLQNNVATQIGASVARPSQNTWYVERIASNVDVWTSLAGKFVQAIELLGRLLH